MALRIVHEPWNSGEPYAIQWSEPGGGVEARYDIWREGRRFESETDAILFGDAMAKGHRIIKEWPDEPEAEKARYRFEDGP